ncbi:MAG: hypothetical protein IJ955_03435 [Oscillospiraceae bacterium]|nr:hypothetical protein [Oscillospiraceae bacterium]
MKYLKHYLILLMCIAVFTGCSSGQQTQDTDNTNESIPNEEIVTIPAVPEYTFEYKIQERRFTRENSGEEYASYRYSLPTMHVKNLEELSSGERENAKRNVSAFNERMDEILQNALTYGAEMEQEIREYLEEENFPFVATDGMDASVLQQGQILTVCIECYNYAGGAHPNVYTVSHTFDLSLGKFIDPTQIGDDPEVFRLGAARMLIAQAEGLGEDYTEGFWNDYQEIIASWNDAAVSFDETGMKVFFSAYELGPYAMGPVELFLSYEELTDVIGAGGLAHLGVQ